MSDKSPMRTVSSRATKPLQGSLLICLFLELFSKQCPWKNFPSEWKFRRKSLMRDKRRKKFQVNKSVFALSLKNKKFPEATTKVKVCWSSKGKLNLNLTALKFIIEWNYFIESSSTQRNEWNLFLHPRRFFSLQKIAKDFHDVIAEMKRHEKSSFLRILPFTTFLFSSLSERKHKQGDDECTLKLIKIWRRYL